MIAVRKSSGSSSIAEFTVVNKGPGPGPSYSQTDEGLDWSQKTGRAMAANLVTVAQALAATPMQAPPD